MNKNAFYLLKIALFFSTTISSYGFAMEKPKKLSQSKLDELRYELDAGITSGERTGYNVWLEITNLEKNRSFHITIDNAVFFLQKKVKRGESIKKLVQLVKASNSLSSLQAFFSNKRQGRLLNLELCRSEIAEIESVDLYAHLYDTDDDTSEIDQRAADHENNNNYVVNIQLKGENLQESTLSVYPATPKHLEELVKKSSRSGSLIERGSRIISKFSEKKTD